MNPYFWNGIEGWSCFCLCCLCGIQLHWEVWRFVLVGLQVLQIYTQFASTAWAGRPRETMARYSPVVRRTAPTSTGQESAWRPGLTITRLCCGNQASFNGTKRFFTTFPVLCTNSSSCSWRHTKTWCRGYWPEGTQCVGIDYCSAYEEGCGKFF